MKRTTILLLLWVLLLTGCALTGQVTREESLKIGFIGPLSGPAAEFGIVEKNVIEMVVADWGSEGFPVKVFYEDGRCTAKDAVMAAEKLLYADDVDILLTVCSSEALGVAPLAEERGIIVLSAYAMHPELSDHPGVFRLGYSDTLTAQMLAGELEKHSSVAIIYEETPYAVSLKDDVQELLDVPVKSFGFSQNDLQTRTLVLKVLEEDPRAIFVDPDSSATGLAILKVLVERGYDGSVYTNFIGSNEQVQSSPHAQGVRFFGDPLFESSGQEILLRAYEDAYGNAPAYSYPAIARYDSLQLIKEGFWEDDFASYLRSNSFSGLLGNYVFDEKGDVVGVTPSFFVIEGGVALPLS